MTKSRLIAALLCLAVFVGVSSGVRADAPALIPVQGFLSDAKGAPVKGTHRVTFSIFNAKTGGKVQHTDDFQTLDITNGAFVAYLGMQTDLDLGLFQSHGELWLEVVVDGTEIISPRMQLGSVPYAAYAQSCGDAANASEATHAASADTASEAIGALDLRIKALESSIPRVTGWEHFPSTITIGGMAATNVMTDAWYRRLGDTVEVQVSSIFPSAPENSGTVLSGVMFWSLPPGIVMDMAKSSRGLVGIAETSASVTDVHICEADVDGSGTMLYGYCDTSGDSSGANSVIRPTFPTVLTGGAGVSFNAHFPVVGWTTTTP